MLEENTIKLHQHNHDPTAVFLCFLSTACSYRTKVRSPHQFFWVSAMSPRADTLCFGVSACESKGYFLVCFMGHVCLSFELRPSAELFWARKTGKIYPMSLQAISRLDPLKREWVRQQTFEGEQNACFMWESECPGAPGLSWVRVPHIQPCFSWGLSHVALEHKTTQQPWWTISCCLVRRVTGTLWPLHVTHMIRILEFITIKRWILL